MKNNRKFKHKKTGRFCIETNYGNSDQAYRLMSFDNSPHNLYFPKDIIEDSDDWEEINQGIQFTNIGNDEEGNIIANCPNCGINGVLKDFHKCNKKNYEILSFSLNDTIKEVTWYNDLCKDKYAIFGSTLQEMLKHDWIIHSIKRLPDNKIFTIGDFVKFLPIQIGQHIKSFYFDNLGEVIVKLTSNEYLLESINHCRECKLFTTEDGIDIFKGCSVYYVNKNSVNSINFWTNIQDSTDISINFLYFSKKENAEDYIIKHKPCLSYKEVKELIDKFFIFPNDIERSLYLLIKSKLKL